MTKLLRVIKETITYVEIGESVSSSEFYWSKDFRRLRRVEIGKAIEEEVEALREPTQTELALWPTSKTRGFDDD